MGGEQTQREFTQAAALIGQTAYDIIRGMKSSAVSEAGA